MVGDGEDDLGAGLTLLGGDRRELMGIVISSVGAVESIASLRTSSGVGSRVGSMEGSGEGSRVGSMEGSRVGSMEGWVGFGRGLGFFAGGRGLGVKRLEGARGNSSSSWRVMGGLRDKFELVPSSFDKERLLSKERQGERPIDWKRAPEGVTPIVGGFCCWGMDISGRRVGVGEMSEDCLRGSSSGFCCSRCRVCGRRVGERVSGKISCCDGSCFWRVWGRNVGEMVWEASFISLSSWSSFKFSRESFKVPLSLATSSSSSIKR